jgi:[acyl-carrier-protein] S-malonyltransferase
VISGEVASVEAAMEACTAAGAKKVVRLPVSGAFHSPLMEYALEGLREGLAKATFVKPSCPVIANVDALAHDDPAEFADLLAKQLVSPVRWEDSMRFAVAQGVVRGVEAGAGKVLMGLMRSIDRAVSVTPVESVEAAVALKGA